MSLMNCCSFTNLFWRIIANLFVKKENDRYRPEPPVIPNGFEKVKGFAQSVLTGIFAQDHVVRRAGRHEDNGRDVIEALDPFTPLVPLTAHVKHTVRGRFKGVAGGYAKKKRKNHTHTHTQRLVQELKQSIKKVFFFSLLLETRKWGPLLKVDFVDLEPRLENTGSQNTTA